MLESQKDIFIREIFPLSTMFNPSSCPSCPRIHASMAWSGASLVRPFAIYSICVRHSFVDASFIRWHASNWLSCRQFLRREHRGLVRSWGYRIPEAVCSRSFLGFGTKQLGDGSALTGFERIFDRSVLYRACHVFVKPFKSTGRNQMFSWRPLNFMILENVSNILSTDLYDLMRFFLQDNCGL